MIVTYNGERERERGREILISWETTKKMKAVKNKRQRKVKRKSCIYGNF